MGRSYARILAGRGKQESWPFVWNAQYHETKQNMTEHTETAPGLAQAYEPEHSPASLHAHVELNEIWGRTLLTHAYSHTQSNAKTKPRGEQTKRRRRTHMRCVVRHGTIVAHIKGTAPKECDASPAKLCDVHRQVI